MRFRLYILISAAAFWFILSMLFLYRSTWDKADLIYSSGVLTEFGMKYTDSNYYDKFLGFKIEGNDQTFGLKKKTNKEYNQLISKLKVGDTVSLHYSEFRHVKGQVNLQIDNMKVNGQMIVDLEKREYRDRIISSILFIISATLGGIAWWQNKSKSGLVKKKTLISGLNHLHN